MEAVILRLNRDLFSVVLSGFRKAAVRGRLDDQNLVHGHRHLGERQADGIDSLLEGINAVHPVVVGVAGQKLRDFAGGKRAVADRLIAVAVELALLIQVVPDASQSESRRFVVDPDFPAVSKGRVIRLFVYEGHAVVPCRRKIQRNLQHLVLRQETAALEHLPGHHVPVLDLQPCRLGGCGLGSGCERQHLKQTCQHRHAG